MATPQPPADRRYTSDHEWITGERPARVGITDFAADALGDVVYVDLPAVGDAVTVGTRCAEIESTKSVSDIFAPATGTITAVNEALADDPGIVNQDPYGAGWLFELALDGPPPESWLTAEGYRALVES